MRITYANTYYNPSSSSGGNAHIRQFTEQATNLGHEVWTWSNNQHPAALQLPTKKLQLLMVLRRMDAICSRIEDRVPNPSYLRWSISPYKQIIGSPITVWEFNTVPEFGRIMGRTETQICKEIKNFKKYSRECDIAVCVSNTLSDYVRNNLGIQYVVTVPNGSDPEIFHPNVTPVQRIKRQPDHFNIVWIGSADLAWHNFGLLRDTALILFQDENAQNIQFHIIGHAHALMRDMPPNVSYHGSERYDYLPHWLAAMDVGLCLYHPGPADYSSPLKVFDYMSSGLTVVGTEQPQLREIFDQLSQLDLLIPLKNPKSLAETLISLAKNPERVRYQGKKGRQLVLNFYNWTRAVRDTINHIEMFKHKYSH